MNDAARPRCTEVADYESARQTLARILPVAENDLPWQALAWAHERLGDTPEFSHALGTALVVAELGVGADAVAAAFRRAPTGL